MEPGKYYTERIIQLEKEQRRLTGKKSRLAWLRFAAIAAIITAVYLLWPWGWIYVIPPAIVLLSFFIKLVFIDADNNKSIDHNRQLIQINKDELLVLEHTWSQFENGAALLPKEHPYANDLDIFGSASLYQYINRTTSANGRSVLAGWLLYPAAVAGIAERQLAVKELNGRSDWRQSLQAFGREKNIQESTQEKLAAWLKEPASLTSTLFWSAARWIIPVIMIAMITLNIAGIISDPLRNLFLLASGLLAWFIARRVMPVHNNLSKIVDEMEALQESIAHIEISSFESPLLKRLQAVFGQQGYSASGEMKKLKKILERLDLRFNPVVFVPLAIFLQWDLQQVLELEKWKKRNREQLQQWLDTLGNFEALNSFSTLSFNNPGWCFPTFKEAHFFIEGSKIGHPLINPNKRVDNDISIHKKGELMLITGSNMAGKSTYLRSIGINVVLAMAGAPVCTETFSLSPVQLISSMRIADNLEESTSTFYAELKKLKAVIDRVNNNEKIFILLDEILRGTNSLDRHTGSVALVKQLIRHEAAAIIATHDVELAKLKTAFSENILNYHFDVQVNNDELYFDYRLKEGICTSLNASILMKKIGIEI